METCGLPYGPYGQGRLSARPPEMVLHCCKEKHLVCTFEGANLQGPPNGDPQGAICTVWVCIRPPYISMYFCEGNSRAVSSCVLFYMVPYGDLFACHMGPMARAGFP